MTDMYGPLVYRLCRKAGLEAEDAADVGQKVFDAAAQGLPGFRRDRAGDSFGAWLRVITRRKLLDYKRTQRDQPSAAGGTSAQERSCQIPEVLDPSLDGELGVSEHADMLHRALGLIQREFTENTWQAFWRVTVEGRAPAKVGKELGMSPGAVHIAKCRVLKRLRDEFQGLLD